MSNPRKKPSRNKKTSNRQYTPSASPGKRGPGSGVHIQVIFGLMLAIVLVAAIIFAVSQNSAQPQGETLNVYFLNTATNKIEPEVRTIPTGTNTEIVQSVLAELAAGPRSSLLSKTIPDDVTITEVVLPINSEVAEVKFSESYDAMPDSDEIFCRVSLVFTLTELDFITDVRIFVGEREILNANGEPMGPLNRNNVSISPEIPPETVTQATYKIYFADNQGLMLVPEERTIEIGSNQIAEKYIVEQIILGPTTQGLYRTIPSETKINNVHTDESICYVDLNADFINRFEGGSTAEKIAVYSIVNSLTELPNVKKVQFFIDGNKVSDIKGHLMDISLPFDRDETLIAE